jgi:S-DNA-T family DNA segregation ATPase FtsK/SpoIIIE
VSTAVPVRNIPTWLLWVNADPIKLDRWGKFVWLPLLGLGLRALVLRPVKLAVVAVAVALALAVTLWLGLALVAAAWALDRWIGSRGWAASGLVARSYRRCQVRGKLRRGWTRYLVRARINADGIGVPRHGWIRSTDTGLRVRVKHGAVGVDVDDVRERIKLVTGMVGGLQSIRVRDRGPDFCELYVNLADPLAGLVPAAAMPVSAFPRVTLGKAAEGHWYCPTLLSRMVLIVGSTGAGKSSLCWDMVQGAEQWEFPPQWYVVDKPGGIELGAMDPTMDVPGIAVEYERDPRLADKLFQKLAEEAQRRNEIMRRHSWKQWKPGERAAALGPLAFALIDEVLQLPERATKEGSHLRQLLQLGRASGVQVIANTQLPQREQGGLGRLADLFTARFVGGTAGPGMTASALGDSGVSDAPAHLLSLPRDAGIFFAQEEGVSGYTKFRAGFVDDDHGEHLPIGRGQLRGRQARAGREITRQLQVVGGGWQ